MLGNTHAHGEANAAGHSPVNLDQRYVTRRSVYAAHVDDDFVLLDARRNRWLSLNRSGATLWTALAEGTPVTRIVDQLSSRSRTPRSIVARDVGQVLSSWQSASLIEVVPAASLAGGTSTPTPLVLPLVPPSSMSLGRRVTGRAFLCVSWALLRVTTLEHCAQLVRRLARSSSPRLDAVEKFAQIVSATQPRGILRTSAFQCLETSLATVLWCQVVGVPATWCIGARSRPFAAHAWAELHGHCSDESLANDYSPILRA